jgi:thiol-disulfide isomerase/thioredoxin
MRFNLPLLVLSFISFPVFFLNSSASGAMTQPMLQPGNGTSEQQFKECLKIAKQGNVQSAFENAQRVKNSFPSERLISVSYINTLLTLIDQKDTELDVSMLNEVINVVNSERLTKQYDGQQDPEIAYHFMKALGRLANSTMAVNERVSAKIRIYEGKIATNLKNNPNYPKNAMEALAAPLFSMAQGHAIRSEQKAAFVSLGKAVDVGFGDFEKVMSDPILARLDNAAQMEELVDDLKVRYQRTVDEWSRTVLAEFQPFQFKFDLDDIEGGRISNQDFVGKVIVLDMWATWCPPCRKGIPHYIELQRNFKSRDVAVLGVSMDNANDPNSALETVRDFVNEQKFNYPCAMGDQSFSQQVPGKQVLPTTLFIDQNNNVRYIARGYHDYAKVEALTKALANESQPVRAGLSFAN